jgi:diguanylate cyclase (GGDEF)-like protein
MAIAPACSVTDGEIRFIAQNEISTHNAGIRIKGLIASSMPIPVRFLLASPRRLAIAVTLFVLLDLSVLVINLWIAEQVARDAVAINLAGRQRMLSQKITKSLLLAHHAPDAVARQAARAEGEEALRLFESTLHAFDQGGPATGGDGEKVMLRRVETPGAREPLATALRLISPLATRPGTMEGTDNFRWAMDYMVANNLALLRSMNQLTSALERHSVQRTRELRVIQTGAFALAMINFLLIVLGLVKQYHHVKKDGHHWREVARRDALTGLYNRTALRDALDADLASAVREGKPLAVLLLDLDGFKPINDRYGHAIGDALLIRLADILRQLARESDTVARLGGDEFALLCPSLHGEGDIGHFCDRIVEGIATMACEQIETARVHASIGVSVYPSHGENGDELLAAADRAMYRSKGEGGNRWRLAELNR